MDRAAAIDLAVWGNFPHWNNALIRNVAAQLSLGEPQKGTLLDYWVRNVRCDFKMFMEA